MQNTDGQTVRIDTKYKKSLKMSSAVWSYFGYKFVNDRLADSDFYYCALCYDKEQTEKKVCYPNPFFIAID